MTGRNVSQYTNKDGKKSDDFRSKTVKSRGGNLSITREYIDMRQRDIEKSIYSKQELSPYSPNTHQLLN